MQEFDKATLSSEAQSDYALAKAIDKKFRYTNLNLAFETTCELVVPMMKDLGTDKALKLVLTALDPNERNARMSDIVPLPPRGDVNLSLRSLVFPPQKYSESGSDSNIQLARILNALTERDPIEQMRRPQTGQDVFHLPVHPIREAEARRALSKEELAQEIKTKLTADFLPVIQGHLYNQNDMSSTYWMLYSIDRLPERLENGGEVRDAVNKVLNDCYSVGRLLRVGYDVPDAVKIVKDERDARRIDNLALNLDAS